MIVYETLWFFMILFLFGLLFSFLNFLFLSPWSKDMMHSFECGFNSFKKFKSDFCIRFYNIAILFLLVDLEIVLFLPLFMGSMKSLFVFLMMKFIFSFMFFLLLLLVIEMAGGGLKWKSEIFVFIMMNM